ncbi:MAG: phosphoribosylformylglycinamidine synthase subunit PurQ [Alphaproteobacteria bacterium]|nr:phosphoribosylformylglycinamidine synthase subunit PurQ [Alphaproteobacteria bacterium]
MKSAIVIFPGTNRERDMALALKRATGKEPALVWHRGQDLPKVDLIVLPGGFAHGDYLRCGAMAAHSPIMAEVKKRAAQGVTVLAVCNGFQAATEAGLLPGVLMPNAGLKFICRDVHLKVERSLRPFTGRYNAGTVIRVPVAHHDGNYYADKETLDRLEGEWRVLFRYFAPDGTPEDVNGSARFIAGIVNERGNVLGMMPHPEDLVDPLLGGTDGAGLFQGLAESLAA